MLIGCGGEAIVSLGPDGAFGAGGPNQEAALAAAMTIAEERRYPPVSSTPTAPTAAPRQQARSSTGIRSRAPRMRRSTSRPRSPAHRSGEALAGLGDLIVTGPTQTNVNDLFVIAVGAGHGEQR